MRSLFIGCRAEIKSFANVMKEQSKDKRCVIASIFLCRENRELKSKFQAKIEH